MDVNFDQDSGLNKVNFQLQIFIWIEMSTHWVFAAS